MLRRDEKTNFSGREAVRRGIGEASREEANTDEET
jgi:hypothetical protein